MNSPKVSQEAREQAAAFLLYSSWETATRCDFDRAMSTAKTFAQFEQLIRTKVIEEAALVADKAADRARNHDMYPAYCLNAHASAAEAIASSIRQLGEKER